MIYYARVYNTDTEYRGTLFRDMVLKRFNTFDRKTNYNVEEVTIRRNAWHQYFRLKLGTNVGMLLSCNGTTGNNKLARQRGFFPRGGASAYKQFNRSLVL